MVMADDLPANELTSREPTVADCAICAASDLVFLRHWFAERGEQPPTV
jgi:hypothetical protein